MTAAACTGWMGLGATVVPGLCSLKTESETN